MKKNLKNYLLGAMIFLTCGAYAQDKSDWQNGVPEGCTTITVGKLASADGSVITSHTDDSHRTRAWMDIVPAQKHEKGSKFNLYERSAFDSLAMPIYQHKKIGEIDQVEKTFQYLNTAYPCMNEKQLAMGESTFGGREELYSDACLIDCQRLEKLMLERCTTARQAIKLADELLSKYGWRDFGECLTIADKKEVWHFEVVGPGKGKIGAVWVAQRVPDGHVSINANASTIKEIDLKDTDHFMASKNIFSVAKENGWWKEGETFRWNYAYAPKSRLSLAARRREWRVLSLMAPSLHLDANDKDYPFSVKPDEKVTMEKLVRIFRDYYEGTDFNFVKNIKQADKSGKETLSPFANPFMPYDMNRLFHVNGGWGELGERTIARWYTMYATIIQCRNWLPDEVGGIVWLAQDNVATSLYIPVYAGSTDLAPSYKIQARRTGYTRKSAWWAFNRLGTLTAQRWGDMRYDVEKVFVPLQNKYFAEQANIDKEFLGLSKKKRSTFLTNRTIQLGNQAVEKAWEIGDGIWTKYDEKF
ncbi:dipeptidase [Ancylomarina longa]|uniref:Dipeptidase n=1 Tax=Ancylomarina longa TaxID=2487017 RepID=A0A434AFA2_9BACT|nr:C69 family dipeptidase [Ancylomarina longa]RUT73054.1 peptidase C69 [Ancylomarina longa]